MSRTSPEQNLAVRNGTVPGEEWVQIGTVRCQDCQQLFTLWSRSKGEVSPTLIARYELYLQRELVREHIGLLPHAERYRLPSEVDLPGMDGRD